MEERIQRAIRERPANQGRDSASKAYYACTRTLPLRTFLWYRHITRTIHQQMHGVLQRVNKQQQKEQEERIRA
jgi:hypothetical protein